MYRILQDQYYDLGKIKFEDVQDDMLKHNEYSLNMFLFVSTSAELPLKLP